MTDDGIYLPIDQRQPHKWTVDCLPAQEEGGYSGWGALITLRDAEEATAVWAALQAIWPKPVVNCCICGAKVASSEAKVVAVVDAGDGSEAVAVAWACSKPCAGQWADMGNLMGDVSATPERADE